MANKDQPNEVEVNEDPRVIAKVEEMMEPEPKSKKDKAPELKDEKKEDEPTSAGSPPPLDIFAETPSAPLLIKKKSGPKSKSKTKEEKPESENKDNDSEAVKIPINFISKTKDTSPEEELATEPVNETLIEPSDIDDPKTSEAIDDIVAHEGDVALQADDQTFAEERPAKIEPHNSSHKLFWSFVVLLCFIAAAMAVFLINPNIKNPLNRLHWSSIKRHL